MSKHSFHEGTWMQVSMPPTETASTRAPPSSHLNKHLLTKRPLTLAAFDDTHQVR